MANIPGGQNIVPSTVVDIQTVSRGVSIPSGTRLAVIIGEGEREEILISSATGGGNDGLDPTCTTTTGSDGRHFILSFAPAVQNRSRIFKNGIELNVLEDTVDSSTFDDRFDVRVDITTGCVELQRASLVDQGGAFFTASGTNVGNGTITGLALEDPNAPSETWTVRCSTVLRDGYGVPIDGYAIFTARGSETGVVKDGYGNIITWQSNGITVSNGILSFAIEEGSVTFREGDTFIIEVSGGALIAGDSLVARYIGVVDVDDPEFFTDINALAAKHGQASLTNRITLGAQLAFANGAPGVFALQAAPAVPRRQSFVVEDSATGETDVEDLTFPLPLNVIPDTDSNINFFITDPVTNEETQILPNKVDFFDPAITAAPATFISGVAFNFSYTVVLDKSVQKAASDGVITPVTGTTGTLSSATVEFDLDDLSATRTVNIFNASIPTNNGEFAVVSVSGGVITLTNPAGFTAETGIEFQVLDSVASSARILLTDDLALTLGQSLRVTVVDTKDADFFDAGWLNAYEAAEKIDASIVVPLPSQTISAIFQNGKSHVEVMSNLKNKKERVLFIGGIQGLEPENVIGTEPAAVEDIGVLEGIQGDEISEILAGDIEDLASFGVQDAFGDSFRVAYFYPDQIVLQIGGDRVFADGFFMAPAAAGFFSGTPAVNTPLTNKSLAGFTILRDKLYAPIVLENLTQAGIAVLQPVIGGGRVIWGKTTTTSGFAEEEELSVVFIRDRIAKSLRAGFRGFIGTAESTSTQAVLTTRALKIVQAFLSQRLITQFADLKVQRDEAEPRQYNITVAVQPVFPVNWIYIKVNFGAF